MTLLTAEAPTGQAPAAPGGTSPEGSVVPTSSEGTVNWRDSLPDDIKSHTAISQFPDVGMLAKSYIHAQSMVGKKGVIVPGEKASDEEWGSFFKSIGQPERDKYDIKAPEGVQVNPEVLNQFKEMAHKNGLLPKQAQGLLDWYTKYEGQVIAQTKAQKDAAEKQSVEQLKVEWGEGFDKQSKLAQMAVNELGGDEFKKYLGDKGLINDTYLAKVFAKVGKLMGEDKIRGEGGGKFGMTPVEIQSEINSVYSNFSHPYFDTTHPSHGSSKQRMEQLFKMLNPG